MTYSLFAHSLTLSDLFLASGSSPYFADAFTPLRSYHMLLYQFPLNFFVAQMRDSTVFDYSRVYWYGFRDYTRNAPYDSVGWVGFSW